MIPLYKAAASLIANSGIASICAPFTGGMGTIFTLHRVVPGKREGAFQPNSHLAVTPEFLDSVLHRVKRRGFDIVSLTEAVKRVGKGESDRPFCAFTFDDGYLDNIQHALPIFRRHNAPMTVFVCTDVIDGTAVLWWEILEAVLMKRDLVEFGHGENARRYDCADYSGKSNAAREIEMQFREMALENEARSAMVDFASRYDVDPEAICRGLGATWADLKKAVKDPLFHVGAHTISHPILSRLAECEVRAEIDRGRTRLIDELGVYVEHFAYPYGFKEACARREFDIVSTMGFKSAVTTRPGVLMPDHANALFALPRVSLNGHYQNRAMVDSLLSGVPFFVGNGFRRAPAFS
ncbi:MAG: polysaccharide deacetylase family protein [Pseudomonadota bacterium]